MTNDLSPGEAAEVSRQKKYEISKAEARRIWQAIISGKPIVKRYKKPEPYFKIADHWTQHGDIHCYSTPGHIDFEHFKRCCFYQYRITPRKIVHQYVRMEFFSKPENAEAKPFFKTVLCNDRQKGAEPITIGYL